MAKNYPLDSDHGSELLEQSLFNETGRMFLKEVKYFTPQKNNVFCGVASMTIALNTLGVEPPVNSDYYPYSIFTQDNIFTPKVIKETGITPMKVISNPGLSLKQVKKILETFPGVKATIHYANDETSLLMSVNIKTALRQKSIVLGNILRDEMGQKGGGHFSPICAYGTLDNEGYFLFLDVSSYKKWGPVWVPEEVLYRSMDTMAKEKCRGYIVVEFDKTLT
ncbi:MAG: hypothetical protein GY750_18415 [Lentisphaerae bacterium]|nr:hypothetical protein [Lentisphaerota bacterium]MCP4103372.1 hypothetical protein [Lentisphaerota bacterium]